ncbi:hypothetical protein [Phocaeicola coprocola]|jgi:hypothetical protein|uniref:M protein repeat protein n=1 Tax=Phocaeicola coprocola TaxID=310298 RepID=A0A412GLI5_9BACT|nr:hypothetical protein [Phocaeicola coprocola]RGR95644.1 hypothetical protein DWY20_08885 [Phocaeicola coprocola]
MGKFTFHLIKKLTGIDIEQLQNDNEALLIKNQQLSFEVKDANKEATYKRTQLTETQEELSLAQTELTQLQTSIAEHQKEISHLQTEISRLQSDKATGLEKMQYSEQEIVSRDNDIQQLKNQLADSERQKEVLATDKKELEAKLTEAEKQKETITASKKELEAKLAESDKQKETIAAGKKELEAKLAEAEKQKETIAASKKELEAKLTEAEKQKETIAAGKKELEEKLTEAEKQKEIITASKKELEEKLTEAEKQKETIAASKKELEEKLTEAEKLKETITASKKELEAKLTEAEKQKETIAASKKELEARLTEAEKQKETIAASKKELEEKLAEVEKQKEILEANKKELEEQSEKSSQDLAKNYTALQRELSETQEKLDAIQSENSTLKANLSELQKKMHLLLEEKEQLIHEKEQMQTPQPESDKEEQPLPQPENEKVTAEPETPQKEEEQQPHSSDILEAYQEMKARLEESTLHYPYTRITSETNGCQYIYESRTLQLKAELFIWGVEGKEVVLEENHFIPYNEIAKIEGLETPFATDVMTCDFSEEGNGEEVAEALLMAICCYHPIHITYRDKNGRISERNLYWICFQPQGISSVRLPYEKIFRDMFDGEIDTDHIMAMCAHTPVPRIFIINQILSIQIYDAFVTTRKGIDTQIDGMYYAVLASQSEAADMIYKCLPEQFKKLPAVISYRAHYWMLEGNYQKAMKLYLSFAPDTEVEKGKTWAAMNIANFDKFIDNDVEAERFLQLKEALKEEGWPI